MSIAPVYGLPGVSADRTATPRRVFKSSIYEMFAGGGVIDGASSRDPGNTSDVDKLRAGLLMGLVTSLDQWAPSILGLTTNAEAVGATAIEVSEAVGDELSRRLGASGTFNLTGPPTANGVVVTELVTYSAEAAGAITASAIVNAFIAGSYVQPVDGSQTPRSLIPDGFPNKVTDNDGTSLDIEWPCLPIGGVIDSSQIIHWSADTSLREWVVNRLNAYGRFVFDHVFMGE